MADDKYTPVSCDYHDELEAASVMKKTVELEFEQQGVRQRERGRIADVFTRDGAEFARLEAGAGSVEIRLDEIVNLRELHD